MVIERRFETVWEVPDVLWERIEPVLLEADPPNPRGRPRADARRALDGIIFRLRSGCQWNRLPKEFGDDSTIHRTFQRWGDRGVFTRIWALLVQECEDLGEVQWRWQSADAAMGKARLGGGHIGPNPTDRGKAGSKRSILVDGDGGPLSAVVGADNVNDFKLLGATLESIVTKRPRCSQHLCLDKGYDNPVGREVTAAHGYIPHIRRIWEEKLDKAGRKVLPARRWVVERTFAWLSKCRAILVRYEKKAVNYLGLVHLACALLWFRRQQRMNFLR